MKFSVILPAFNAENTIRKTLLSLIGQTHQNFEVIIIDDGSTDNTRLICEEFTSSDNRFVYIFQPNSGVSKARNNGIEHANGDYLAFIDSDDAYHPDYLSEFVRLIDGNPECDNFWCEYNTIISTETTQSYLNEHTDNTVRYSNRKQIMTLHSNVLDAALWNKVFKIDIVKNNRIKMPEHISLGEDLIFNFRFLDHTRDKIAIINKPLYNYTKSVDGSLDSKYHDNLKEIYDYIDSELLFYLKKWDISDEQMVLFYNSVLFAQERILNNTFRPQSKLSYFQKIKYNKSILKSCKFKEALLKSNCDIHPAYKFAYRIASWHLIKFLNYFSRIKKIFKDKL
ncbi:MAG: glycosyltransferase family 2 protein [Clostridia bacterium]|nr:glycosyltransferase family 2 protein [Clostridia bacterium]